VVSKVLEFYETRHCNSVVKEGEHKANSKGTQRHKRKQNYMFLCAPWCPPRSTNLARRGEFHFDENLGLRRPGCPHPRRVGAPLY
jgi:hypothetical protein